MEDKLTQEQQQQESLKAALFLAIDMKAAFELHAYRIIDGPAFIKRCSDLVEQWQEDMEKVRNLKIEMDVAVSQDSHDS